MSVFGGFLKQSTSVIVPIGPMVDATDGFTLETAIALATTEAYLFKHGGLAIDAGTNTWSAHLGGGMYNLTLTASNTDTLGLLSVEVHDSAARPFRISFMVLPANIYDSLIGGTDKLQIDLTEISGNAVAAFMSGVNALNADVTKFNTNAASSFLSGTTALNADAIKISGNSTSADNLEEATKAVVTGTVQSGSSTTTIKTNLSATNNDHYNGRTIVFLTGANAYVAAEILDYSGSSKDLTISAVPVAPANGNSFIIV